MAISRWELDSRLAAEFQIAGGVIHAKRWTEPFDREGVVRATGRALLPGNRGWIGLKGHAQELELSADLEMHFSGAGYLGISRLPKGVNLCAMVNHSTDIHEFRTNPGKFFQSLVQKGDRKVLKAQFDRSSLSAVAGIGFAPPAPDAECRIGDAIRMIPPFTGNGMSQAIESAFIAASELISYSSGAQTWIHTVESVRSKCHKRFQTRFFAARFLNAVTNRSWTRRGMMSCLRTVPGVLTFCFRATR